MKSINILSLANSIRDLSHDRLSLYMRLYDIKLKDRELIDLEIFVHHILSNCASREIYYEYYVGFIIDQIGKEFDLLRFGNDVLLNIELKSELNEIKIKKQLIRNKYYLSFLHENVQCYTFVSDKKLFYELDDSENLIRVSTKEVVGTLLNQEVKVVDDIDSLFNPSDYLVSPFNSTDAFVKGRYFLTLHQEEIKNRILATPLSDKPTYVSIFGAAGTGKTLLTYDIANEYIEMGKNVIIFHCGQLNLGQQTLCDVHSWPIYPIKSISSFIKKQRLDDYDIVIIDEAQRFRIEQFTDVINQLSSKHICLFSYDSKQCLSNKEIRANIPEVIDKYLNPYKHKLTEKIRTNKEIAEFIKGLFIQSKKNTNYKYKNIEVTYFSNVEEALLHIDYLERDDWKVVNYTPSQYNSEPFDEYALENGDSAHYVIGQEFDKVAVIIDQHFYFNSEGYLDYSVRTYYHPVNMLFQIVTRTRKKLHLIFVKNEELLGYCADIIEAKV